jgi:sterigmatocystin biosynthesis cytochrome P450 monooxygenase
MSKLPSDVHGHVLPRQITIAFPTLGPLFYVDTWPFGPPMLVATSPHIANQITTAHSLPKFAALREYMKPMTGGMDLTTLEGREWKTWRNVFNSGFSSSHLMKMVPEMIKDVLTFCEILRERAAKGGVFPMDHLTIDLNLDIIGRLVL